jgi:hypothetical protein
MSTTEHAAGRAAGLERLSDEVAQKSQERAAETPASEGLTAVASRGAVVTQRGIADVQRLAGNRATQALIRARATAQATHALQREQAATGDETAAAAKDEGPFAPEDEWEGSIKGNLGDNTSLRHTLNNFGDKPLEYLLRIRSTGHAMVSLETQYEYKTTGLQRAWTALSAQSGKTEEVTNGLPPHSSLHLRFFGERDFTQKDQSYFAGTVEALRKQ